MAHLSDLLGLIEAGDTVTLDSLLNAGEMEGFSEPEKMILTRSAALSGHPDVLKRLFEKYHLYSSEPDQDGRNVLHFAAMSGNRKTVQFAMDVLGFSPMTGDVCGMTPLDYASDAPDPAGYDFLTGRLGFSPGDCYRNPILRGFHPDPSILRVNNDYYLINSSFAFFPGLPIFHSRDLVHWQLIGHAAENLADSGLSGLPGGFGYWAPDISHDGERFWVVATLRRNTPPFRLQMITSASDPQGPWEKPEFLPLDGIDPSLFTDEDGRRYILLNPGAMLAEIDRRGRLISEPEMIYFGSARIKPEGPHLLKKDGWYYLFLAEGGTGFDHMETVMRSRRLRGPYEACPFNPILCRKNPFSPIQRSGHGKLVSTPDGRWYMVYLCGRPVEGRTLMGRETALDPVTWTADGWPMINRLQGPSCLQVLPFPSGPDDRRTGAEKEDWISPRNDPASFASFSESGICLKCGGDPAETGPCSLLLRRQPEACFSQSVRVSMAECTSGDLAGIAGYYDERSFFVFGLRKTAEGCRPEITEQIGGQRRTFVLPVPASDTLILKVRGDGLIRRFYVQDSGEFRLVHELRADYLCDEGLTGGKRFTGATLGLAAIGKGKAVFSGLHFRFSDPLLSQRTKLPSGS